MINKSKIKTQKREKRHTRIRARISGTKERPRLSIFKSNKHMYAQLVDDVAKTTLVGLNSSKVSGKNMTEKSKELGKTIAKMAGEKKITTAVFDRGGFKYTGKIKVFAEAAREGGLKF